MIESEPAVGTRGIQSHLWSTQNLWAAQHLEKEEHSCAECWEGAGL